MILKESVSYYQLQLKYFAISAHTWVQLDGSKSPFCSIIFEEMDINVTITGSCTPLPYVKSLNPSPSLVASKLRPPCFNPLSHPFSPHTQKWRNHHHFNCNWSGLKAQQESSEREWWFAGDNEQLGEVSSLRCCKVTKLKTTKFISGGKFSNSQNLAHPKLSRYTIYEYTTQDPPPADAPSMKQTLAYNAFFAYNAFSEGMQCLL